MALDHHGWHSHPPNARLSAHDGGIEGDATEKFLRLGASITLDMRNPISAAVLRRDDARPHSLPSAAAQRIGALLLDGDDGPAVVARKGALATLACCGFFLLIVRTDFHAANATGFLATPTIGASGSHEVPTEDPRMRLNSNFGAMAAAVALSIGGQAVAQDAVQWRVGDGGNGHWYQASSINRRWHDAKTAAESIGGHLVTLTSATEREFVWSRLPLAGDDCWIGGFQQPNACEPGCGWTWVTGEPWSYTYWWSVAPDNNPVLGNENVLDTNISGLWDDSADCYLCLNRYAIEWSADCNNDGIVDYGQILAGELADANLNNIPDCCEQGTACALNAVQWRVADGGNGHWYRYLPADGATWDTCRALAIAMGAELASVLSPAEMNVVRTAQSLGLAQKEVWLGGNSPQGSDGLLGWVWSDGSPWGYAAWGLGKPNNSGATRRFVVSFSAANVEVWDDYRDQDAAAYIGGAVIEWSADCNNDGLVDYGQILAGELADANLNNIPDCCEGGASCNPCPGDVDNSGAVNGVDLAAILNSWGTSGGKYPGADVNHDSVVNGSDLAIVLNGWGPCP